MTKTLRSKTTLACYLLLVIASLLALQHLTAPLFYDEVVYADLARHPLHSSFYPDPIFFRHPPLHQLVLAGVGRLFGYAEQTLRFVSVVASVATIAISYRLGAIYRNKTVGLMIATLLTFSILRQQYAQAATMYALASFFAVWTVYGFKTQRDGLVLSGFLLFSYTHYFGLLMAPSVLIYLIVRYGVWSKKTVGSLLILALGYLPWAATAIQGVTYHATRIRSENFWYFTSANFLFQASATIVIGFIFFTILQIRNRAEWPIILSLWMFLFVSTVFAPFVRYLLLFLPIYLLVGVIGIADGIGRVDIPYFQGNLPRSLGKLALLALLIMALFIPNAQAYGLYPQQGMYIDLRDTIYTQEWRSVIALIPGGSVATHNTKSLAYYAEQMGRQYDSYQFEGSVEPFRQALAERDVDWVVVQEYPYYEPILAYIRNDPSYELHEELLYTRIFHHIGDE